MAWFGNIACEAANGKDDSQGRAACFEFIKGTESQDRFQNVWKKFNIYA